MNSEFYNVALNRLRYSLVWEDSRTLYDALAIEAADHVLVITSAGCNVLNTLLKNPHQVTAIDLNPVQNQLLRFKCHLIRHHAPGQLRALMGFDGPRRVAQVWQEVAPTLPADMLSYWNAFFESHPAGILTAGKLESYITEFLPMLAPEIQAKLRQLIQFYTVAAQQAFFAAELDIPAFRQPFISYFDDANLSKGRDPALFKYAAESGGQTFYARLKQTISTKLVRDNFFFRFFFFGPENLPETLLPPCYQQQNHAQLRQQLELNKLHMVTGEATSYLATPAGRTVNKASLSNIFEYTSPAEFQRVCAGLFSATSQPLRLIYWNLLQDQGANTSPDQLPFSRATDRLSQQDACFFFRNVRVLDSRLAAVPMPAAHLLAA